MSDTTHSPIRKYRVENQLTLAALGERFSPPYHKTSILRWERDGVPLENVVLVEEVTGIPREQLRPDVFEKSSGAGTQ